ncbi:c-type cytochrome [Alisedimentitalea sp. MJ-SS2]|uniref:c-type cytochrome n=1 Tax=Aliisedimentitalea sp. MJ-SS2 TaxID=3049795 RepID=UPI00290EBE15|nr:c-type cytochrome [Alisedimentitalea sp. MJ-SS2]MDU8929368.1 c-type cytochrome [Alisedimentitalea sp. MJ-SS2]
MRITAVLMSILVSVTSAQADENDSIETLMGDRCAHCHGEVGEASSRIYPRLAGQNRVYIEKQLRNFRDGTRVSDVMNDMATDLTDDQINGLAAFFSMQPAKTHRIRNSKKSLEAVGYYIYHEGNKYAQIPPCAECHGDFAAGDENLPRLAGQHAYYVVEQLKAFEARTRTNDAAIMHSIAKRLTELEINAVALYVSGLKEESQ